MAIVVDGVTVPVVEVPKVEVETIEENVTAKSTNNTNKIVKGILKEYDETPDVEEQQEEEEIIEKPVEKEKSKEEPVQKEPEDDTDYEGLYTWFKQEDLLEDLEEEVDRTKLTMKDIRKAIEDKFDKKYRQQFVEEFTEFDERTGGLLSHLAQGGTLENFDNNSIPMYSDMKESDITSVDKAEKVVRDYFKRTTKYSDAKINKYIEQYKDLDNLIDEAKEALPELKNYEKEIQKNKEANLKRQQQEYEQQQKAFNTSVENYVQNTKDFMGVEITSKLRKNIQENIKSSKTVEKINKNWVEYLPKLTILDELGLLDGKDDILKKVYTTKATTEVMDKVKKVPFKRKPDIKETTEDLPIGFLRNQGYM